MGGVGGTAFDTGSLVDYNNSGRSKCRVFKKWTIPVLTSVKKTIMSLNHSSVNRASFCSVSPCCSIWCTYVQISASTLGVLFKNLLVYLFNPCLLNNLLNSPVIYIMLAVTGIVLLS